MIDNEWVETNEIDTIVETYEVIKKWVGINNANLRV
jgi:hypothetical protein